MTDVHRSVPRPGAAADRCSQLPAGARRVVDATLGDGGHAAAFLARRARRCSASIGIPRRSPRPGARLGDDGIRYLQAPLRDPEALEAIAAFQSRLHPARPRRVVPPARRERPRLHFPPRRAARHADGRRRADRRGRLAQSGRRGASCARVFARVWRRARAPAAWRARSSAAGPAQPFAISDDLVNAIRAVLGPASRARRTSPGSSRRSASRSTTSWPGSARRCRRCATRWCRAGAWR